jgi:glycosyltransferase involved in cell wall biosynthesis
MTILMLIPDFGMGGAERVSAQLSRELAKSHRVIDCVFNRLGKAEYTSGNEVVDLNVPSSKTWIFKAFYFCLRVYRLRKIKQKYRVDLSISHLEGADYINIMSRIHDNIILCIHGTKVHDQKIKGLLGWLRLKIFMPMLYRKASHIVSVSRVIKHELVEELGLRSKKISVINNFVDLNEIGAMNKAPLPADHQFLMSHYDVIITAGRLEPEKNHRLLVRLMPFLLRARPKARLIILGAGRLSGALKSEAESAGLRVQSDDQSFDADNQIFFVGFRSNPFSYFRHAKVFALPSLWEGFPLVLCEALACGVMVIAHDCPTGPREIIAPELADRTPLDDIYYGENGVLIPFSRRIDNPILDRWATAILSALMDGSSRERCLVSGRQRVLAFGRDRILEKWLNLIGNYEVDGA